MTIQPAQHPTRGDLINLINLIPEMEFVLEKSDPLLLALSMAPEDDEPWTEKDEADIEKARKEIKEGNVIPWEQVKKELDL